MTGAVRFDRIVSRPSWCFPGRWLCARAVGGERGGRLSGPERLRVTDKRYHVTGQQGAVTG